MRPCLKTKIKSSGTVAQGEDSGFHPQYNETQTKPNHTLAFIIIGQNTNLIGSENSGLSTAMHTHQPGVWTGAPGQEGLHPSSVPAVAFCLLSPSPAFAGYLPRFRTWEGLSHSDLGGPGLRRLSKGKAGPIPWVQGLFWACTAARLPATRTQNSAHDLTSFPGFLTLGIED